MVSTAVILEFRVGSLWNTENEDGWLEFQRDKETGRIKGVAVVRILTLLQAERRHSCRLNDEQAKLGWNQSDA